MTDQRHHEFPYTPARSPRNRGPETGVAKLQPSKIVMTIPELRGAGAQRVAVLLSEALLERGHSVDLVLFHPTVDYPIKESKRLRVLVLDELSSGASIEAEEAGAGWMEHAKRLIRDAWEGSAVHIMVTRLLGRRPKVLPSGCLVRWVRRLARYLRQERPDFIISHLVRSQIVSLIASGLAKPPVPVFPVIHSKGFAQKQSQYDDLRKLLPAASGIVTVCEDLVGRTAEMTGVKVDKFTAIYNGISLSDIDAKSQETPDHPWFQNPGSPIVLRVGRLDPEKDIPTLIRAFQLLRGRMECRLLLVGIGSQEPVLSALADELGLGEDFDLAGYSNNPYAYMRHSSVFGLSSLYEGLPMVLLEALACGCPVVSTNCECGPREVLADGRYGALVPVGDFEALADALEQAIRNPPLKETLRRRAEEFSI